LVWEIVPGLASIVTSLYRQILLALQVEPAFGFLRLLPQLRSTLADVTRKGRFVLLIVDETHLLPPELLDVSPSSYYYTPRGRDDLVLPAEQLSAVAGHPLVQGALALGKAGDPAFQYPLFVARLRQRTVRALGPRMLLILACQLRHLVLLLAELLLGLRQRGLERGQLLLAGLPLRFPALPFGGRHTQAGTQEVRPPPGAQAGRGFGGLDQRRGLRTRDSVKAHGPV